MFLFRKKRIMMNEEKVLDYLKKAIPKSNIQNEYVYIPKYNLIIIPQIKNIIYKDNMVVIDLSFNIECQLIMGNYVEFSTGIGITIDEAIKNSVTNFLIGPFYCIRNLIESKYSESFETNFFGQKKEWVLFESPIQGIVNNENINIWKHIGKKIKDRLGNKSIYCIKIYTSLFSNGDINSECYINGIYNDDIAECISRYIENLQFNSSTLSLKQYFLIKQDIETYSEYEFSEEEIKEFTRKSLKILGKCNTDEKRENLYSDIYNIIGNRNLAYEIKRFIPEIICELVFKNINYTDSITIIKENDNEIYQGYKNQFTNYYWIYNETAYSYYNNHLLDEEIKTIMLLSSSYEIIDNTLNNGIEIQNIQKVGMTFYVFKEYVPI